MLSSYCVMQKLINHGIIEIDSCFDVNFKAFFLNESCIVFKAFPYKQLIVQNQNFRFGLKFLEINLS